VTTPALTAVTQVRSAAAATLLVGFLTLATVFFTRQAPLFAIGTISDDFSVDDLSDAYLTGAIGLGWAAGLLSAQWTSQRWSPRRRVVTGLTVAACGTGIVIVAPAWSVLVAGHAIACAGAGSSTPAMMSAAYGSLSNARRGLAAGAVLSGSRIGGNLIAPIVVVPLAAHVSWRLPIALGVATLLITASLARRVIQTQQPTSPTASRRIHYYPRARRNLALSSFNCAVLLLWVTAVSQFGSPLLDSWLGSGPLTRGVILGGFGAGAALASFAVPTWSDRIGRRTGQTVTLGTGAAAGCAIALLAATETGSAAVALPLLVLGGFAMGGLPMALSLIPADTVAAGDRGRAMVIPALAAEVAGGGIAPAALTTLATHAGPISPIAITAGFLGVGAVGALFLANMPTGISAETG
jgi:MFS family permease